MDSPNLSRGARDAIAQPDVTVFFSASSAWEIAIKVSLGKLNVPSDWLDKAEASHLNPLAVSVREASSAGALPLLHRDPVDRMLVAQAQSLGLTIVTRDPNIARYDVPVLRA